MGYLGNKLKGKYHKDTFQTAVNMAWPAIVESFFIAFAGLVDSLMVSSLGSYAVAAVGLTTQPKLLGLAFFFALNVSISALVARRRGEQRQGAANETLVTALVFIILAAAAFSVGFVAFASPIIHLCGSTAETHNGAVTYFRIIMGGMIFNYIQMGINSAQRGAGNTKITMRTNVTSDQRPFRVPGTRHSGCGTGNRHRNGCRMCDEYPFHHKARRIPEPWLYSEEQN